MNSEPTHHLPAEFQAALVAAKKWYDERVGLELTVQEHGGSTERNAEDRRSVDLQAAAILEELVEIADEAWGFAASAWRASE